MKDFLERIQWNLLEKILDSGKIILRLVVLTI